MFKYIFIILLIFSLSHCSLNHPVSMWNIDEDSTDKDISNKDISKLNFENETSFEEFKKNVIKYGKISEFPKLD
ncbi:hypothetical protein IDH13_02375 [Pelagibacterales bacterium SAG-MED34]|nr:hypothetical protein [Pelagibacterales bacterium SAG-MED34]